MVLKIGDGDFIDMRESQEFLAAALSRGMKVKRLTFEDHTDDLDKMYRWQRITRGDIDCGDVANWQAVGEIKTIMDAMNWDHLMWQCHKMLWTGKKVAVFIRDYFQGRNQLIRTGVMHDYQIAAIEHRFQAKIFKMNVPVFYCTGLDDTLNRILYFLEHAREFPQPINTYNDHKSKFSNPLTMLCGIMKIGEAHARPFLRKAGTIAILADDILNMDFEYFYDNYSTERGIDEKYCRIIYDAFNEIYTEDDYP